MAELDPDAIEPNFGTIHPLEGLRSALQEDEAAILLVALEALHRFLRQHRRKLEEDFQPCQGRYRIPHPQAKGTTAEDLLELGEATEASTQTLLRDDLVPEGAQLGLGVLPWTTVEALRLMGQLHPLPESKLVERGEGLPVVIVCTSRPKMTPSTPWLANAGNGAAAIQVATVVWWWPWG
ncbi:MAG: hypothetical protein Q6M54_13680 [Thermostichus sp. DRC_bins_24]